MSIVTELGKLQRQTRDAVFTVTERFLEICTPVVIKVEQLMLYLVNIRISLCYIVHHDETELSAEFQRGSTYR